MIDELVIATNSFKKTWINVVSHAHVRYDASFFVNLHVLNATWKTEKPFDMLMNVCHMSLCQVDRSTQGQRVGKRKQGQRMPVQVNAGTCARVIAKKNWQSQTKLKKYRAFKINYCSWTSEGLKTSQKSQSISKPWRLDACCGMYEPVDAVVCPLPCPTCVSKRSRTWLFVCYGRFVDTES